MQKNPTFGDLLRSHVRLLADSGHEIRGWISDDYGDFACGLRDYVSRLPFVLTSRGCAPWHQDGKLYVSFQTRLLERWKSIHILGLQISEDQAPKFLVFSGRRIESFRSECFENENIDQEI